MLPGDFKSCQVDIETVLVSEGWKEGQTPNIDRRESGQTSEVLGA